MTIVGRALAEHRRTAAVKRRRPPASVIGAMVRDDRDKAADDERCRTFLASSDWDDPDIQEEK